MLLTETLTITVAARSPRVLATNWDPTMQAKRGLRLQGRWGGYDEEQLGQKVMSHMPAKYFTFEFSDKIAPTFIK